MPGGNLGKAAPSLGAASGPAEEKGGNGDGVVEKKGDGDDVVEERRDGNGDAEEYVHGDVEEEGNIDSARSASSHKPELTRKIVAGRARLQLSGNLPVTAPPVWDDLNEGQDGSGVVFVDKPVVSIDDDKDPIWNAWRRDRRTFALEAGIDTVCGANIGATGPEEEVNAMDVL